MQGYDGIAITGSALHVYACTPEVMRQVELVRAALDFGTPLFGSCWGLRVITAAAGGSVRKNPRGREIGFGRGIRLTEAGRKHPMYVGKVEVFNAPTVHLDEVETVAPGTASSRPMRCRRCRASKSAPRGRSLGACSITRNIH